MRVTLLGTGSSGGVPFIGCECEVCQSINPKNKRLRVSIYIEVGDTKILVDTSPDMREQTLRAGIKRIDAVLFTHDHSDHTHGIDDLRSFNYLADASIPVYSNTRTTEILKKRFDYAFQPRPEGKIWTRPSVTPHIIPDEPVSQFKVKDVEITAFEQGHGKIKSLGFRIGNFAYSTDADYLSEEAFGALKNLDIWVVDCLRYRPSPTHSHLEHTLEWVARVKPKLAILTHMTHDIDYEKLSTELPPNIVPGYDGMAFEL